MKYRRIVDRFTSKTAPGDAGCVVWTGGKNRNGYGKFWDGGRQVFAHRWAWEQMNGSIPWEHQIDHTCGNKACVNPRHLEAVTARENVLRSFERRGFDMGRTS